MKRTLLLSLLALPFFALAQDTLNRLPMGVVTFSGVDTVNVTKYQGKVFFNDPSGVFRANQIAVNDRIYVPTGATYTVDSVWGASLFDANIRMVQNSGVTAKPSGKGFVTRPTKNYGLPMVPPDNDAGISPQMHALLMSNLAFKVDSLMRDSLLNLRDVAVSSPANNAFFVFDSTAGKWKDTIVAVPTGVAAPNTQSSGQVAYFSGNDTLSGENDFFWDASNNRLGIGTTTPAVRLEIKSNTVSAIRLNNTGIGAGVYQLAHADTVEWTFGAQGANRDFQIYNWTDSVNAIYIQRPDSKVGINTTTPQTELDVAGTTSSDATNTGDWVSEKTFFVDFPNGTANQKVDIYWPSSARLQGGYEVTLSSGYVYAQASGMIKKRYGIHYSELATQYLQQTDVPITAGSTPSYFSISDVRRDTANNRWRITIANLSPAPTSGNYVTIHVKSYIAGGTSSVWTNARASAMQISPVYVDTTTISPLSQHVIGNFGVNKVVPSEALHVGGRVRVDNLSTVPTRIVGATSSGIIGSISFDSLATTIPQKNLYTVDGSIPSTTNRTITIPSSSEVRFLETATKFTSAKGGSSVYQSSSGNMLEVNALGLTRSSSTPSGSSAVQLSSGEVYLLGNTGQNINIPGFFVTAGNKSGFTASSTGTSDSVVVKTAATNELKAVSKLPANLLVNNLTITSGVVSVSLSYFGSGTPTISNLSAGIYKVTIPAGVDIRGLVVTANNTVLSGSNEFTLIVDNVANSIDQWYNVQVYDIGTNSFVDQHATSTNHTQAVASNATTLVFPGMNLFGSTGFRLILR